MIYRYKTNVYVNHSRGCYTGLASSVSKSVAHTTNLDLYTVTRFPVYE